MDSPRAKITEANDIQKSLAMSTKEEQLKGILKDAHLLHNSYLSNECDSPLSWKEEINRNEILVHSCRASNSDWSVVQATTTVLCHKRTLLKFLLYEMNIYDDMVASCQLIHDIDDHSVLRHVKCKAIWPTAPRDFLACTTWSEALDGTILVSTRSAPDDFCPRKSDYVRGNIVVSGYRIQSRLEGGCDLCLIAHTELGGTLPVSIINMLSATAPFKMLTAIRAVLHSRVDLCTELYEQADPPAVASSNTTLLPPVSSFCDLLCLTL